MTTVSKVFVYGTLGTGVKDDMIQGDLYDLGAFPAAINVNSSNNTLWGEVIEVPEYYLQHLDVYEGVSAGLYRRIRTTTLRGVEAWVYEYARPLPDGLGRIEKWTRKL